MKSVEPRRTFSRSMVGSAGGLVASQRISDSKFGGMSQCCNGQSQGSDRSRLWSCWSVGGAQSPPLALSPTPRRHERPDLLLEEDQRPQCCGGTEHHATRRSLIRLRRRRPLSRVLLC